MSKVYRKRWNHFRADTDWTTEIVYKGEGRMAPSVTQGDSSRIYPGLTFRLFVPKPGKDDDGDQNGDRITMYGAIAHYYSYLIIEGYVIGDGTYQAEADAYNHQEYFHVERWDVIP